MSREEYPRNGRRWTEDEVSFLRNAIEVQGWPWAKVSKLLGRAPEALKRKALRADIHRPLWSVEIESLRGPQKRQEQAQEKRAKTKKVEDQMLENALTAIRRKPNSEKSDILVDDDGLTQIG